MADQKWAELAQADGELKTLRTRLSLATENANYPSARQLIIDIAHAEDGREVMVAVITETVAAG